MVYMYIMVWCKRRNVKSVMIVVKSFGIKNTSSKNLVKHICIHRGNYLYFLEYWNDSKSKIIFIHYVYYDSQSHFLFKLLLPSLIGKLFVNRIFKIIFERVITDWMKTITMFWNTLHHPYGQIPDFYSQNS